MSTTPKKEFVLTHVVKNVSSLRNGKVFMSKAEEHFGVEWYLKFYGENDVAAFFVCCEKPENTEWSTSLTMQLKLLSANGKTSSIKYSPSSAETTGCKWGLRSFLNWDELLKEYLVDDTVTIEAEITILKMTGIERKAIRFFDATTEKLSDVVLMVEYVKFYVSKLFLAGQSSYFKALFIGSFQESEKSEISLADVDPEDFQNFLEVLHGEPAIDDKTITGILNLADMYDAPTVIRQCEDFLMRDSEKTLKEKLGISAGYNLKKLKNKCLQEIKTVEDIRSVVSGDLTEMDLSVLAALLQKSLSLH